MSTIDLQEVDKVFVLSKDNFQCVFHVTLSGHGQYLGGSLSRSFLAREELDEVKDLSSILHDDVLREALHSRTLHCVVEPSGNVLSVHFKDVEGDRLVADQGVGSSSHVGSACLRDGTDASSIHGRRLIIGVGVVFVFDSDRLSRLVIECNFFRASLLEPIRGEKRVICGSRDWNRELVSLVIKEVNESREGER
jgi:hypothetical protein